MTQIEEIEELKRKADREMTLILRDLITAVKEKSQGRLGLSGLVCRPIGPAGMLHVWTKFEIE